MPGIVGALLTGAFAWTTGAGKPFWEQLGIQALAVAVSMVFTGLGSFILLKLVGLLMPLRVTTSQEISGIDISARTASRATPRTRRAWVPR